MAYQGAEEALGEPRVLGLPYLTESNGGGGASCVCGAQDGEVSEGEQANDQ